MADELTVGMALAMSQRKDVVERWLAEMDASEDTKTTYRIGLMHFVAWLRENEVTHIDATTIRAWRDSIDLAPSSVNLRMSAIRSFFAWALEQGLAPTNPAAGIKGATRRGTSKSHKRDELTSEEVLAVLDVCDVQKPTGARDRAIIALMAYTGLRTVEVHRANVGDLKTRGGRLVLWVQGKGHETKDDYVVLPKPAERELRGWLRHRGKTRPTDALFISLSPQNHGERMSRAAIRATVKQRYANAGIVGDTKTTHSLRHSAISSAIRHGATPTQAQAMARHSNVNTTLIYYHEIGRTSNPAEDLIDYGDED